MKYCRIFCIVLAAVLLLPFMIPETVSANSARTYWAGVSGSGALLTDGECPVIVQKERLTFDIPQFPEHHYACPEEYLEYSGRVAAEYVFYNPSEYSITAKLRFPFGNIPDYGMLHDSQTNKPMYRTDSGKYGVNIDGTRTEAVIRHSFAYPFDEFELEKDMARLADGYVEDSFYHPEVPVWKYQYHTENVDKESASAATVAIELPFGEGKTKYIMIESNGYELLESGFRISAFLSRQNNTDQIIFYVIGVHPDQLPEWKFYENGACEKEIQGTMILDRVEKMTFLDLAMCCYPSDTECNPSDWYNAVVTFLRLNEYADGFLGNDFSYGDEMFDVNRCLMRWFEYEITLDPDQTMQNTVIAPIYPDIDESYEPAVYTYKYLLSPARTWKEFGPLEIAINTPFFLTGDNQDRFQKSEEGYVLSLDGLPDEELVFSLSSSSQPIRAIERESAGLGIVIFLVILLVAVTIITVVYLFIRECIKRLPYNARRPIWIIVVLLILTVLILSIPRVKTAAFVKLYHKRIEHSLTAGMGVPADDALLFGYMTVNSWEGKHAMTEFIISGSGFGSETTYYGCYYSPDDVPLAFQNEETVKLSETNDGWIWEGEGDNNGFTAKIMDKWYYFEASF